MIEDKKEGLLIAENDDEAAWYNVSEEIKNDIKILKARNIRAEKDLKVSAREVHAKFIKGAKAVIKSNKTQIKIQKEFLKLAENKLNL